MKNKNLIDVDAEWRRFGLNYSVPPKNQKRVDQAIRRAVRRITGLMHKGR